MIVIKYNPLSQFGSVKRNQYIHTYIYMYLNKKSFLETKILHICGRSIDNKETKREVLEKNPYQASRISDACGHIGAESSGSQPCPDFAMGLKSGLCKFVVFCPCCFDEFASKHLKAAQACSWLAVTKFGKKNSMQNGKGEDKGTCLMSSFKDSSHSDLQKVTPTTQLLPPKLLNYFSLEFYRQRYSLKCSVTISDSFIFNFLRMMVGAPR